MTSSLISLIIALVIIGFLFWAVDAFLTAVDPRFRTVIKFILGIVALIMVLRVLLPMAGL